MPRPWRRRRDRGATAAVALVAHELPELAGDDVLAAAGGAARQPAREEVLELVGERLSALRIAQRLQLGRETVRTHIRRLYERL